MRIALARTSLIVAATMMTAGVASAQTPVTLPDSSQTTLLTANVSEQARVTVPSGVTFNVVNIAASTAASAASVTVDNIVLANASKQLTLSVQAAAENFTNPGVGGDTWSAGDVSWNAATFTNATGAAGALAHDSYKEVATCAANAVACSTDALVFTLAANEAVTRSGNHTLNMTWKFESIVP